MIGVDKENEKKFNFRHASAAHDKKTGLQNRSRKSLEQGKAKVFMQCSEKIKRDRLFKWGKYDATPTCKIAKGNFFSFLFPKRNEYWRLRREMLKKMHIATKSLINNNKFSQLNMPIIKI